MIGEEVVFLNLHILLWNIPAAEIAEIYFCSVGRFRSYLGMRFSGGKMIYHSLQCPLGM